MQRNLLVVTKSSSDPSSLKARPSVCTLVPSTVHVTRSGLFFESYEFGQCNVRPSKWGRSFCAYLWPFAHVPQSSDSPVVLHLFHCGSVSSRWPGKISDVERWTSMRKFPSILTLEHLTDNVNNIKLFFITNCSITSVSNYLGNINEIKCAKSSKFDSEFKLPKNPIVCSSLTKEVADSCYARPM